MSHSSDVQPPSPHQVALVMELSSQLLARIYGSSPGGGGGASAAPSGEPAQPQARPPWASLAGGALGGAPAAFVSGEPAQPQVRLRRASVAGGALQPPPQRPAAQRRSSLSDARPPSLHPAAACAAAANSG